MVAQAVLLPTTAAGLISVRVHPVALFSICDAYIRRNQGQRRVIGTLLGTISEGVFEVKGCYVVPHTETAEQVQIDVQHHTTMYQLHQRVSSADVTVGWFATGSDMFNSDSLIQQYYSTEAPNGIHLKVDTTLENGSFQIAAYQARALSLGPKQIATEFVEVPCDVVMAELQRAGAELLAGGVPHKPIADLDSLAQSLGRLESLLESVHSYVADVAAGKRPGDATVGRYLADTLAAVPRLGRAEFERLFNDSVQDSLMVSYLSNLLRAQIALAERLGTSQLPIM